jgi:CheY-like chemotaxis protein
MTEPATLRILLVEDDGGIAQVIKIGLQDLGMPYHLDHALTAEEGFDLWQRQSYDLVLTDYNLRGKNGLDLITQIKADNAVVPTVLVTAYDTPKLRREARLIGIAEFVAKPFFVDQFTQLVRTLLPARMSEMGA